MNIIKCVFTTFLLCSAINAHAVLMVFTDRTTWEASLGTSVTTEDFNGVTPFNMSTGVNSAGLIDIELLGSSGPNRIDDGSGFANIDGSNYYHGALDFFDGGAPSQATILITQIIGFGADWISTTTGGDLSLTILGETVNFDDHLTGSGNGFLGIISTNSFSSIILDTESGAAEQFGMDNFSFAQVTEPTTLALFGLGLAGLGFARRKKA